ncbi:MAG TPA: hypothetical protein VL120_16290 [Solirubrobacteraceae bacterium]|nr:hypothetical protein [Solirubrobacteraceae bacterium]
MRARAAVAVAVAVAVACAALAGCGGGGGGGAQARTATAGADTAGAGTIDIDEPSDGQSLRGRAAQGGGLALRARVRGRARPGSTVFLSASCRPQPCSARADAGPSGRWSTRIELRTPRAGTFVTIDASYQEQVIGPGSAVATVELVSPQRTQQALHRDAVKAKQARRARRRLPPASAGTGAVPLRPALPHEVLVIGDSLAVGMEAPLRAALPGWRVTVDGLISRPLAEGMRILAAQPSAPAILAFSLFTNDDPRGAARLEAAVRATATRPGGCAVWATIVAPPVRGVSYNATNQLLRGLAADPQLAPSLQLVDWSAVVAASPSLVAGDGVHATPAGYEARAELYAAAIRACAGG